MDFSKLQIQKTVNTKASTKKKVETKVEIQEIVQKKYVKALIIQDPTLAYYKKVFQYCETCITESVFDIIKDIAVCKVCQHKHRIGQQTKELKIFLPVQDFLLLQL